MGRKKKKQKQEIYEPSKLEDNPSFKATMEIALKAIEDDEGASIGDIQRVFNGFLADALDALMRDEKIQIDERKPITRYYLGNMRQGVPVSRHGEFVRTDGSKTFPRVGE